MTRGADRTGTASPAAADRPRVTPLTHAFRPFFLLGALWAALAVALWLAGLRGGGFVPSVLTPLAWHGHAMVFGFGLAIVAGFLLTAGPVWTGLPRPRGAPLAALAALWVLGRVAMTLGTPWGAWPAAVLDLAFPVALLGIVAWLILRGHSERNVPVVGALAAAVAGDALVLAQAVELTHTAAPGNRVGIAVIALLAVIVGGRVVPAFTRNWLKQTGRGGPFPAETGDVDRLALVLGAAALTAWAIGPTHSLTGVLAGCAAAAHAARLARWRGWRTGGEPLVTVLHLGYAWLPLGFALIALHAADAVAGTAALHALTAGLMGTFMLAMMTRVARGHTGRPLTADGATVVIHALALLAGLSRVLAGLVAGTTASLLAASAAAWIAAFLLYAAVYGPMLLRPRVDA